MNNNIGEGWNKLDRTIRDPRFVAGTEKTEDRNNRSVEAIAKLKLSRVYHIAALEAIITENLCLNDHEKAALQSPAAFQELQNLLYSYTDRQPLSVPFIPGESIQAGFQRILDDESDAQGLTNEELNAAQESDAYIPALIDLIRRHSGRSSTES